MKGRPTEQAKRAIDGLKAAGLRRREFRVRTERHKVGRYVEYGDARIGVYCFGERAAEVTPALLAQGFGVTQIRREGQVRFLLVSTDYRRRGQLSVEEIPEGARAA